MANAPRLSVVPESSRPRKLGRYELEERLGGDDTLETFRARVRGLAGFDRIFAVKCLHRPRGSQINLNDPFIKTARRLASINDPRVARVLDADVIDGVMVAVTEFVHGLDLDRFRECAQFSGVLATGNDEAGAKWQKIVAYVGAEVAGGLAVLHALTPPLVHGGLSPRNIATTARGSIKILDAGLVQAAEPLAASSTKRSVAYAARNSEGLEWSPKADVRALGSILFELATGELPAPEETSATVRKVLDSLWPPMADFIAGMLSDDPSLRPTSAEAAKILGEYWSDIPDASMVTEMAALVRNFSAFVTEPVVQNTAPPIVHSAPPRVQREPEPEPDPIEAEVFSITPPPPLIEQAAAPPPAPEKRGQFDDEPTVVRQSGSYVAALFKAAPTDSEIDESLELAGLEPPPARPEPPPPPHKASAPSGNATLLAYRAPSSPDPAPAYIPPEDSLSIPLEGESAAAPAPDASMEAAFPVLAPSSDSIPELAEWGRSALAALGDQAGVAVAPLSPIQALHGATLSQPPPPPVSDPAIEEAFAFASPPPPPPMELAPEEPAPAPMLEAEAEFEPEQPVPASMSAAPSESQALLEDDLVDEATGAAAVPEGLSLSEPAILVRESGGAEAAEKDPALAATAFLAAPAPATEWESPRLAHGMVAPQEDRDRTPEPRSAARSASVNALNEVDAEALANSTRSRRIVIGVAVVLLAGVGVFGGLSALGVIGKHAAVGKVVHSTHAVKVSHPSVPPDKSAVAESVPGGNGKAASNSKVEEEPTRAPGAKPEKKPATAAVAKTESKLAATPTAAQVPVAAPTKPAAAERSTSGGSVSVAVSSSPPGAMVWINGEERGTTPCSVKVPRGSATVTLVKAGHLSSTSTFEAADGRAVEQTLQAVDPPLTGDARFRAECRTTGKFPIVVDGRETGILCPNSKLRVDPGAHSIGVLVPATGKVHAKEITLSAGVRSIMFGD